MQALAKRQPTQLTLDGDSPQAVLRKADQRRAGQAHLGGSRSRPMVQQSGASHVLHFVESADTTCLERIEQRNVERPEGSHHLTPEQFARISSFFEPPSQDEGFEVRRYS